jgi:hypothetical protein
MLHIKFTCFPAISLLFRAGGQAGGRLAGWVCLLIENKTNSAQLELELGLCLTIAFHYFSISNKSYFFL